MPAIVNNQAFADIDDLIGSPNGVHQAMLAGGWTLSETISAAAGAQDRVYYSAGSNLRKGLWLRITHDSVDDQLHFRAYSFWSAGTGYNVAGDVTGATCVQMVAGAMTGWINADGDGIAICCLVGAVYNKGYFGALPPAVPGQRDFYGVLDGPKTGTNTTASTRLYFQAGTSFANLEAGQFLWVVNQNVLGPSNVERVQVDSLNIPDREINLVGGLSWDYDIGALVAIDPQPIILWGNSGGILEDATPYALHSTDAYSGALSHVLLWNSLIDLLGTTLLPSDDYGAIPVSSLFFYNSTAGTRQLLGALQRFRRVPTGTLIALDDVTLGTTILRAFTDGTDFMALEET
jgi:hypothetical protein